MLSPATERADLTPHTITSPILAFLKVRITWQQKLSWGRRCEARTFCLAAPGGKQQEEKRTHYPFRIFLLSNFPLLTGKISALDREEIHAVKGCSCFSYNTCSVFHYLLLPHHYQHDLVGKTTERTHFPPQSVKSKAKLGHFSMNPLFKPGIREAKEVITYCELAACGILGHLVNLPIQLGKVRPKTFFNSPEMAQFFKDQGHSRAQGC